jgi:hypothetical protein
MQNNHQHNYGSGTQQQQKPQMVNYAQKPKVTIFENESENRLFSKESEIGLDSKIAEMEDLMKTKNGFGAPDEAKDELYGVSKKLWKEYAERFQSIRFSLYMNRLQFNFITDLLTKNMEYDINTVFFAIELKNAFESWEATATGSKFTNDKDSKEFEIGAIDLEYLWQLVSTHKVKGLSKSTYLFAQVLKRMIELRTISLYYDSEGKRLSKDIQSWVASFEPQKDITEGKVQNNNITIGQTA